MGQSLQSWRDLSSQWTLPGGRHRTEAAGRPGHLMLPKTCPLVCPGRGWAVAQAASVPRAGAGHLHGVTASFPEQGWNLTPSSWMSVLWVLPWVWSPSPARPSKHSATPKAQKHILSPDSKGVSDCCRVSAGWGLVSA